MGMDLYGEKPTSDKGEYFRNNCWWWRPLWDYVNTKCNDILTEKDWHRGHFNDGYLINEFKANAIADRLEELDKKHSIKSYEEKYMTELKALPKVKCNICEGVGVRLETSVLEGNKIKVEKVKCYACEGTGKRDDSSCSYPFSRENVIEFKEFCRASGGFRIC